MFINVLKTAIILIAILPILWAIRDSSRPRHEKVVACYIASWAKYRPGKGEFSLDNLRPEHCTHLIYSFAGLNATSWTIRSLDPFLDLEENYGKGTYKNITSMKNRYPGLKVSLAIGGWNEKSENYSLLAEVPERRSAFVSSVVHFLNTYGFDGLDLDWEFPGQRGGNPATDKDNFVKLIQELSESLKPKGLLLTAAISADRKTIDVGYDIPEIAKYLDFIHVMAYDYHGAWDKKVLPNSPLRCDDFLCVESTIDYLLQLGAPVNKLVLGLPMYGRTFVLTDKLDVNQDPFGANCLSIGFQGNYTREDGFMGYNEICKELTINPKSWRTGWNNKSSSAYAVHEDKVVVYDNIKTLLDKVQYVSDKNLAGVMIWSIDTDDFRGDCAKLHQEFLDPLVGLDYPLMRTVNLGLSKLFDQSKKNTVAPNSSGSISFSFILLSVVTVVFL